MLTISQMLLNGLGGSAATRLKALNMDPGALRPWLERDHRTGAPTGRVFCTVNKRNRFSGEPVFQVNKDGSLVTNGMGQPVPDVEHIQVNAPATLFPEDWQRIDRAVTFAAKQRLQFWNYLYGANPRNLDGGLANVFLKYGIADGSAVATISMDPIRKGERARPIMDTAGIPLPTVHSDGTFTLRETLVTGNNPTLKVDTVGLRMSARAVGESVEKLALGISGSYSYGGGTVYGMLNQPNRFTKSLSTPTGSNNATVIAEVQQMAFTLWNNQFYGPYVAFYSPNYEQWLDLDYSTLYPGVTLRDRLAKIGRISAWQELDFLTGYQIILAQLTDDMCEGVQFLPFTTVQWEEQGGFEQCYKVLAGQVPLFKADYRGLIGINHGAA